MSERTRKALRHLAFVPAGVVLMYFADFPIRALGGTTDQLMAVYLLGMATICHGLSAPWFALRRFGEALALVTALSLFIAGTTSSPMMSGLRAVADSKLKRPVLVEARGESFTTGRCSGASS